MYARIPGFDSAYNPLRLDLELIALEESGDGVLSVDDKEIGPTSRLIGAQEVVFVAFCLALLSLSKLPAKAIAQDGGFLRNLELRQASSPWLRRPWLPTSSLGRVVVAPKLPVLDPFIAQVPEDFHLSHITKALGPVGRHLRRSPRRLGVKPFPKLLGLTRIEPSVQE